MSNPEFGSNPEDREYTIHGPNLTEEDKQEVNEFIRGFSIDAEEPVEGEIEKSPEIEMTILEINQYREELAKELGLPQPVPIKPTQVHLLSPELFHKRYPEHSDDSWGNHENLGDGIFIKYDPQRQNVDMIKMFLLHEGVHIDSYRAFFTKNEQGQAIDGLTGETRSGYVVRKPKSEREHEHFSALNEAVVQRTTWDKIKDKLPSMNANPSYVNEVKILDTIIRKVAEANSEDEQAVWGKIRKGLFTGEMMHLRQIEKVCGNGSLEVLANLTTEDLERTKKTMEYFTTGDASRKLELAEELIGE